MPDLNKTPDIRSREQLLADLRAVARPLGIMWLRDVLARYEVKSLGALSDDGIRAILADHPAATPRVKQDEGVHPLALALRHLGRKRVDLSSEATAKHLVEHLRRSGLVIRYEPRAAGS